MYQPVKLGFERYIARFFNCGIAPTTRYLGEYVTRPLSRQILWAPARMVDLAEDMLASWMRDDSRGDPTSPYTMPIILAAMAKDVTQSQPETGRSIATHEYVVIDGDPKDRLFLLRTFVSDIRAQMAIAAHEEQTARSLASQLLLWFEALPNRTFHATYRFAGIDNDWPVQVVMPDSPASLVPTDAKNLTLLTLDLTLRASVPLYQAPKPGEPNDGQGDPADPEDPAGYPFLKVVDRNGRVITEDEG